MNMKTFLVVFVAILLLVFSIWYAVFQWNECRKDSDHTFWHCMQVMD